MPIINSFSGASARGYGFTSGGPSLLVLSADPAPSATVTTYGGYIVFKFTSSGTLNVGSGAPGLADVLLVGGGSTATDVPATPLGIYAGNGGAGGKVYAVPGSAITGGSPIPVVVGGTATASTFGPLSSASGSAGGTPGAGATSASTNGSPGGNGPVNNYLTGSPQYWSGGGGGGGVGHTGNFPGPLGNAYGGSGGSLGGGPGGNSLSTYITISTPVIPSLSAWAGKSYPGTNGTANSGGGGGGRGGGVPGGGTGSHGTGGSGVVVVRFPDAQFTV